MKLLRELGLQPRQIAVWFQNRRTRWKTKQLEQLYDVLKHQYDVVSNEKQKLQEEVEQRYRQYHNQMKIVISSSFEQSAFLQIAVHVARRDAPKHTTRSRVCSSAINVVPNACVCHLELMVTRRSAHATTTGRPKGEDPNALEC
ncbi:hypothetical protein JHK86_004756 [Glycine max]|nr:hypothetical protein JHK86_004756 [Glycine max]